MMRELQLAELVAPLGAELRGPDRRISGVTIDSRRVAPGDLFVALRGPRFDGHDYLQQAARSGAVAAVVQRPVDVALPLLVVADTGEALAQLGAFNRRLFHGPLVAITGSCGKTTAKNLVASVLSRRGTTLATEGNFNNEVGVPLTLLRLDPACRFAVVEMGAAGVGHIAWLCRLGLPQVSILLNAMPAHLEGFGSVEAIARTKGEILDGLGPEDTAIFNADQSWAAAWRERAGAARILDFALEGRAALTARDIETRGMAGSRFTAVTPAGELAVELRLPGRHNVANALAAIGAGLACGLGLGEIGPGLAAATAAPGRLAARRTPAGIHLLDDCYNANPGSVRAALDLLAECPPRRIAVLGAMRELGEDSPRMHREVGEHARRVGIDLLWGVGDELQPAVSAFGAGGRSFPDRESLLAALAEEARDGDTVLVKGSRSAGMETVAQALMDAPGGEA